jgi:hypothetical protein
LTSFRQFMCAFVAFVNAMAASAQTGDEVTFDWRAFAQFTAEHDDGGALDFGVDRLRFRSEIEYRRLVGVANFDFAANDLGEREPGNLANVVTDLFVDFVVTPKHQLRFGEFKTPLGMDFSLPAGGLDLTKRGIEAGLVLNRDIGVMLSARNLADRFGYDFGYFNIAGRSAATNYIDAQGGEDQTLVGRAHYDDGPWHAELAFGRAEAAGGPNTGDYEVADVGIRYDGRGWTGKAEWIDGRNVFGNSNHDEDVYYLHGDYAITDKIDLVARFYEGASRVSGSETMLRNTYLGVTWRPVTTERYDGRVQINYVIAGGDELAYTGIRGYRENALLTQFQFRVRK